MSSTVYVNRILTRTGLEDISYMSISVKISIEGFNLMFFGTKLGATVKDILTVEKELSDLLGFSCRFTPKDRERLIKRQCTI